MLIRAHSVDERFEELVFDQPDGVEVLTAQLSSLFPCAGKLVVVDSCGRLLATDEDIEDINVLEGKSADVWCIDEEATAACSAVVLEEEIIQPCHRIIDTDFLICGHCRQFIDASLVVHDTSRLISFRCRAASEGFLCHTASEHGPKVGRLTGPPGLFQRRKYLDSAIRCQQLSALEARSNSAGDINARVTGLVEAQERIKQEQDLQARIQSGVRTVLAYEEEVQQEAARAAIDYDKVREGAQNYQREHEGCADDVAFIMGLLAWFKGGFFTWVNKPPCDNPQCPGKTNPEVKGGMEGRGVVAPSPEEVSVGGAGRTELYECTACHAMTRFPRFNKPSHLLASRRGRCGEFANAFCLICRALSLDARWVLDYTDHVWVEVWAPSQGRYLHCDPCERALDTPLVYEAGWGKKLTYIFSFSRHGVVDATPRYSRALAEVLMRRGASGPSERFVAERISAADVELEQSFVASSRDPEPAWSSALYLDTLSQGVDGFQRLARGDCSERTMRRRKRLLSRELLAVSLETGHEWKTGEMVGRVSGDKAWKQERGELGNPAPAAASAHPMWLPADSLQLVTLGGETHGVTGPFDTTAPLFVQVEQLDPSPEARRALLATTTLSSLTIWSSSFVNGLQCSLSRPGGLEYVTPLVLGHNDDPQPRSMSLVPGERVSSLHVRAGAIVDSIRIVTSAGQDVRFGDSVGGNETKYEVPSGWRVLGFRGGRGGHVHNISVVIFNDELSQ